MSQNFYLQGTDRTKESFNQKDSVSFEWNIIYKCNFRCKYCFFEGKWEEYGKRNVILSVKKWIKIWEKIHSLYGRCAILITGGEPFIYPNFIELIRELSEIHYPINISSNGSFNLNEVVENFNPEKVSISLSFQPGFNKLEEIVEKKNFLEDKGFHSDFINLCCYPEFFDKIKKWIEYASGKKVIMKLIPFIGDYNGIKYPEGYTEEEKEFLGINKKWENNVKTKGKPCKAGMKSALIFPDGKVARCGQIGEKFLLGYIWDDNFRLLDKPLPCEGEYCPCLEGEIIESENRW